ncbi:D-alanine--poly(phosphoribitol) ligase subunit DltA [Fructobacillus papyrifericola]|uniref:D-alanine--D-alanyl carrier protein ligase n=1 Tax=Fructobacillus papyrifericola TaxID=2713172 RepID=A0ABS5QTN9_9LACO|nr:D-alanine--poly(phosphoribitol) ligase subunit DltA [Fructobacillus papyrifericola]MBS9336495.1 D-alanine--poly(phosphoribitol) ligase subunit DltA [Fructobacillus papyrifericola]
MIENIYQHIDQYAVAHPDQVAYNEMGVTHTYGELKAYSDSLAAFLDEQGIAEKAPIMVFGGHQFEMVAAFLAAVKSGHAYAPVDKDSTNDRIENILEIGQPAAVIALDELPMAISSVPVYQGEELKKAFTAGKSYDVTHGVLGDDNYYIIFTSGTTGKPKGVQISHKNALSYINWMLGDDFDLKDGQNILAQTPFSFDVSVMSWAGALLTGGVMKALPKQVADDFKQLFAALPAMELDRWVSTPSFANVALLSPDFNAENYPRLKTFLFCGEVLTSATSKKLRERFPEAKIYNTYGPTEATVAVSALEITDAVLAKYDKLPIGYMKEDMVATIMDKEGNVLPAGEAGELVLSGPAVSKGYLNNPEKTAAAFLEVDGQPGYKTGDLCYADADGLLHYKGRMDFQIKLHGFRIELEEVAQHLTQSQWVEQAAAVPRYDQNGDVKQMLAIVVPKENDFEKPLDLTNAIREDLKDIIMPYMMPTRFIYRDKMPLTQNGKIDLKGLIAEVNGNA